MKDRLAERVEGPWLWLSIVTLIFTVTVFLWVVVGKPARAAPPKINSLDQTVQIKLRDVPGLLLPVSDKSAETNRRLAAIEERLVAIEGLLRGAAPK